MAVEIREIVIRAITSPDREDNVPDMRQGRPDPDRETVVRECVRQVMALLRKKEER